MRILYFFSVLLISVSVVLADDVNESSGDNTVTEDSVSENSAEAIEYLTESSEETVSDKKPNPKDNSENASFESTVEPIDYDKSVVKDLPNSEEDSSETSTNSNLASTTSQQSRIPVDNTTKKQPAQAEAAHAEETTVAEENIGEDGEGLIGEVVEKKTTERMEDGEDAASNDTIINDAQALMGDNTTTLKPLPTENNGIPRPPSFTAGSFFAGLLLGIVLIGSAYFVYVFYQRRNSIPATGYRSYP